ncbi:hypothetical protein [Streptomyces chattanoogensis]|uniref:hypothetical protein n=1 Tax=Streptomyces chattanoogensis TaxID=66876 RepID=UPI0012FF158A|nr:hypothetical protein [Streptomyces chattanoogensis]
MTFCGYTILGFECAPPWGHPCEITCKETELEIFTVRHIAATTALVSAALLLTACTDNEKKDSAGGQDASASASATPGDGKKNDDGQDDPKNENTTAPASARPTTPSGENGGDGQGGECEIVQDGHQLMQVDQVEGADNHVIAYDATRRCHLTKPGTGAPLFRTPGAKALQYPISDKLTMNIITGDGLKRTDIGNDLHRGISHLKTCAPTQGWQQPSGGGAKEYCHGGSFYDVQLKEGKIVNMYEIVK